MADLGEMLGELESNLVVLSDPDQDFVLGAIASTQMGGVLVPQNVQRLQQIHNGLHLAQHNAVGKPLSLRQTLTELSAQAGRLSAEDRSFLQACAGAVQAQQPLTPESVQKLLDMHGKHG